MSAHKPMVDDPAWRQHFEDGYEFAEQQWEREEAIFGPRTLTLIERLSRAKQRRIKRQIKIESLPDMCDVQQTADALNISPGLVREMVNGGELPAERYGRKRVIRISRIEIYKRLGMTA